MNLARLRGILRERDKSYEQCAKIIGKSLATFHAKVNGKVSFTMLEFVKLVRFLQMTEREIMEVMFDGNIGGK